MFAYATSSCFVLAAWGFSTSASSIIKRGKRREAGCRPWKSMAREAADARPALSAPATLPLQHAQRDLHPGAGQPAADRHPDDRAAGRPAAQDSRVSRYAPGFAQGRDRGHQGIPGARKGPLRSPADGQPSRSSRTRRRRRCPVFCSSRWWKTRSGMASRNAPMEAIWSFARKRSRPAAGEDRK